MGLYNFPHILYHFPHILYCFPHMLYSFPSHANIGQQNLIFATPLSAFHIYIYLLCFEEVFPLHYELHGIYTFSSQTWASHCWRSLISSGDFITPSVGVWIKTLAVLPIVTFGADVVGTTGSMGGQEQLKRPLRSFLPLTSIKKGVWQFSTLGQEPPAS